MYKHAEIWVKIKKRDKMFMTDEFHCYSAHLAALTRVETLHHCGVPEFGPGVDNFTIVYHPPSAIEKIEIRVSK